MATRIKPPHHPVTGYPLIDNELRNAWREHRAWLTSIGPAKAAAAVSGGAGVWPVNPPRTMKKQARKNLWTAAFIYHDVADYKTL